MPELPEVETVRSGLSKIIGGGRSIASVKVCCHKLRFPVDPALPKILKGQKILGFRRRAKYLLWDLEQHVFVSHLGMTGSWREIQGQEYKAHDHLLVHLDDGRTFAYNDPRRFGLAEYYKQGAEESYHRFLHLGPEPLSREFSVNYLAKVLATRKAAIKSLIMDQKIVVGVGNIYACEALYSSKIHPLTPAHLVTKESLSELVRAIKKTLRRAIKAGGSTISDFRQAGGESGYFQHSFLVYGQEGEPCRTCDDLVENVTISGRGSFFCPTCQELV